MFEHVVPAFVVRSVMRQDVVSIGKFQRHYPDLFVLAMRLDGFSSTVCDEMHVADPLRGLAMADTVMCHLEEAVRRAVKTHFAGSAQQNLDDLLVKVSCFGDSITFAGPFVLPSDELCLVATAKCIMEVMESSLSLMGQHCPWCRLTAIASFDSGYAVVMGMQRASLNVFGVAQRQAESVLRAAPAGFLGVSASFARTITNHKIDLPLDGCRYAIGPKETWAVRGAGSVEVHLLISTH